MVELADDEGPRQRPILTEREAAEAYAGASRERSLEWLMASDEPDRRPPRRALQPPGVAPRPPVEEWDRPVLPGRGESNDEAKAVCGRCPVRRECFDAAAAVWRLGRSEPPGSQSAAAGRGVIVVVTTVVTDSHNRPGLGTTRVRWRFSET